MTGLGDLLTAPWSPVTVQEQDRVDTAAVRRLAATLDLDPPTHVPALWHWLAFLPDASTAVLGTDGHPPRGGLLPPVRLPRRMFAGGHFTFHGPIAIDEPLQQRSWVSDTTVKEGRSGQLVFVTVRRELSSEHGLVLEETDDIVYRGPEVGGGSAAAPPTASGVSADPGSTDPEPAARSVTPTEALLFRFSALTFNAHRIHYDAPYARDVEGYPALVVHGPLIAIWLAGLAEERLGAPLRTFSFRGRSPAFLGETIELRSTPSADGVVVTASVRGRDVMTAEAS